MTLLLGNGLPLKVGIRQENSLPAVPPADSIPALPAVQLAPRRAVQSHASPADRAGIDAARDAGRGPAVSAAAVAQLHYRVTGSLVRAGD
jgi:hypothetical protein